MLLYAMRMVCFMYRDALTWEAKLKLSEGHVHLTPAVLQVILGLLGLFGLLGLLGLYTPSSRCTPVFHAMCI